jgi:predicted RNA binding protein YcfA (HicA-like mRNA interferase family)
MSALNAKQTYKNLLKKGFRETEGSGDHKRIAFYYEGKLTRAKTMLSHNNQDIGDTLISLMAKQTQLSKKDFVLFAKCDLDMEGYIKILKANGTL